MTMRRLVRLCSSGVLCRQTITATRQFVRTPSGGCVRFCSGDAPSPEVKAVAPAPARPSPPVMEFEYGDTVVIHSIGGQRKTHRHVLLLEPEGKFGSHSGNVAHDDILAAGPGGICYSSRRKPFLVARPTLEDAVLELPRSATPTYPKDAAATMMLLGLRPGDKVLEAGSGSAGLTGHLANAVGDGGKVFSCDILGERHNLCRKNLRRSLGSDAAFDQVEFHVCDVSSPDGLPEQIEAVDAVALDVMEPWAESTLSNVCSVLKPGGRMVVTCPNTTQVHTLVSSLGRRSELHFQRMLEVVHREWTVKMPHTLHPSTHQGPLFTAFLVQFMRCGRTVGVTPRN